MWNKHFGKSVINLLNLFNNLDCCLVKQNGNCCLIKKDKKLFPMPIVYKIIPVYIALTERSETVLPEVVNNDVNWGPTEVSLSKSWTRNGIFFPKLFWPYCKKKLVYLVIEKKKMKFVVEGREFAKKIEITRTIHLNSVRSEQFLKQNAFLTCSRRFLRSKTLEKWVFKLKISKWDLET